MHSGTKMASLAECLRYDTRQRSQNSMHSGTGLPSASNVTHGKGGRFAECLECDTRQSRKCLPSASTVTHGKETKFAECLDCDTWQRRKVCGVPKI